MSMRRSKFLNPWRCYVYVKKQVPQSVEMLRLCEEASSSIRGDALST
ncbi:MAG: hypothetical protein MJZ26_13180 [Fibrobacter sp.]|nr:hypothetical protein [Fibrobacter sp.]